MSDEDETTVSIYHKVKYSHFGIDTWFEEYDTYDDLNKAVSACKNLLENPKVERAEVVEVRKMETVQFLGIKKQFIEEIKK